MNLNKEFEKYVEDLYNINPDDLEGEYIKVVKSFYIFSRLTSGIKKNLFTSFSRCKK